MNIFQRIAFVLCMLFFALPAQAKEFTVLTNMVPPIKYMQDGEVSGITGEMLMETMRRAGHSIKGSPRVMPLSEALMITMSKPDTICLGLARNPSREEHFKWVGPVFKSQSGIVTKKSRNIYLPTLGHASRMTFASVADSAPEKRLLAQNFDIRQLKRFSTTKEAIQAMVNDEVEGVLMAVTPTYHLLKQMGLDPENYQTALVLGTMRLYFAFNPDTDDRIIDEFQTALDDLKVPDDHGYSEYLGIISKYYKLGF